jgi:hypothetical protein
MGTLPVSTALSFSIFLSLYFYFSLSIYISLSHTHIHSVWFLPYSHLALSARREDLDKQLEIMQEKFKERMTDFSARKQSLQESQLDIRRTWNGGKDKEKEKEKDKEKEKEKEKDKEKMTAKRKETDPAERGSLTYASDSPASEHRESRRSTGSGVSEGHTATAHTLSLSLLLGPGPALIKTKSLDVNPSKSMTASPTEPLAPPFLSSTHPHTLPSRGHNTPTLSSVFPLLPPTGSKKEPEEPPRSPGITATATPPKTLRSSSSEGVLCALPTLLTSIPLAPSQSDTLSVSLLPSPSPAPLLLQSSSSASTPSKAPTPTSTPVAATRPAPLPIPSPVAAPAPVAAPVAVVPVVAALGLKSAMLSFENGQGQIGDDPFSELS